MRARCEPRGALRLERVRCGTSPALVLFDALARGLAFGFAFALVFGLVIA
jgi:hypothetical protein